MTDEREQLLEDVRGIVAGSGEEWDDVPKSDANDTALRHLIGSKQNIQQARGEIEPTTIQTVANTAVLGLEYRTRTVSKYR
ncbi:hypothetical protein VB773_14910 [Haloarculaceae archaeon H-GB2-1]|nr:hypothetical protein [Haloarculaceae archaeon H-GB1-1]MEA5408725.1 hypothetical protein [Haloarculaceae archaeon H-GB2-1]